MAVSEQPLGYPCEFVDSIPDDFYCKKCSLVARKLTITNCCGESYCHACIADIQQQDKPCPTCGEQYFNVLEHIKYQRQIEGLQVYCNMRERGCDWLGTLEQLDSHLDPDCQHVDTNCPLNCQQTIPKNKVEQHVAKECIKRDFICQYCAYKATYEVVVNTHLPECIYFPLQCPNFCGVTCERDVMEDHMRMCRLVKVVCEFSDIGCNGRFKREDQEEHTRQNTQKHLSLTATATVKMNQQIQNKLQKQEQNVKELEQKVQEQEQRFLEENTKLYEQIKKHQADQQIQKQKIIEQEQKLQQQEQKCQERVHILEQKQKEQEQKLWEQEKMLKKLLLEQEKTVTQLQDNLKKNEISFKEMKEMMVLERTFTMEQFSKEKMKDSNWKSPAMYTHLCGYKFYISIDIHWSSMRVYLCTMQGEFDHLLKWPTEVSCTLELINQQGRENIKCITGKKSWKTPTKKNTLVFYFKRNALEIYYAFLEHTKLKDFLNNDTLSFNFTDITVH